MRQVSTKVLGAMVLATFLCSACHADGLTEEQFRKLLDVNNQILIGAMKDNTDNLARVLSQAIENLGTRIVSSHPSQPPIPTPTPTPMPIPIVMPSPSYSHKQVRHVYAHKYVYCCRVMWEEDPCWWY
jgi:hypothetical protein